MKKLFLGVLTLFTVTHLNHFPSLESVKASTATVGQITTSGGKLNIRSSNSTSSKILTQLNKGTYVTIKEKVSSWYKIEYQKDKYGYCASQYLTPISATKYYVSATSLNIRTGPSTAYSKKDALSKGTAVFSIKTSNAWHQIVYQGSSLGYVNGAYLQKNTTATTAYSSIKLNVASYKQFDTRWKNVKLGKSSATIGKSGCLTTAFAMAETYRRKVTVLPSTLAKQYSYTSSGALYWPSTYQVITSSSNYLSKIYQNLQNGKPTIIGAKTSAGNQHYVIVYGFSGGNSLSTSSFLINDPGSSSRTKLNQFLNAYQRFYKMAVSK